MLQGLTAAHLRRVVEKAYRRHGLRLAFAGLYCCAQKKIAAAQVRLQPQYAYQLHAPIPQPLPSSTPPLLPHPPHPLHLFAEIASSSERGGLAVLSLVLPRAGHITATVERTIVF